MKPTPQKPRIIIAQVDGSGMAATAIVSELAVVAGYNMPSWQPPYSPEPPEFPHPPAYKTAGSPKKSDAEGMLSAEVPPKTEYAEVVGLKVMLEGVADKSTPLKVAVAVGALLDNENDPVSENDHDTRSVDVTLHELQLSTMSPFTVPPASA